MLIIDSEKEFIELLKLFLGMEEFVPEDSDSYSAFDGIIFIVFCIFFIK
ncbi:hypothetical protein [Bacillus manliponensis]